MNKCCENMEPINIGILKAKWVCRQCDADLNPTEKVGVFQVVKKPLYQNQSYSTPIEPMKGTNASTTIFLSDDPEIVWW